MRPHQPFPKSIDDWRDAQPKIHFRCPKCSRTISSDLIQLPDDTQVSDDDAAPYVPRGNAYFELREFWPGHQRRWCINQDDLSGTKLTSELRRLSGCCGPAGTGGPNIQCKTCGTYVATLKSDCWMPHCAVLEESVRVHSGGGAP